MALRVTCINKSHGNHADPHHAISRLGYTDDSTSSRGFKTREEMWSYITAGGAAYVRDDRGNTAYVAARSHANGTRYVQTHADGKYTDNLLYLPECP